MVANLTSFLHDRWKKNKITCMYSQPLIKQVKWFSKEWQWIRPIWIHFIEKMIIGTGFKIAQLHISTTDTSKSKFSTCPICQNKTKYSTYKCIYYIIHHSMDWHNVILKNKDFKHGHMGRRTHKTWFLFWEFQTPLTI